MASILRLDMRINTTPVAGRVKAIRRCVSCHELFYLNLSNYRGNLKKFLDDTCDELNETWKTDKARLLDIASRFEESIQTAIRIFSRSNVFRKWDGSRFEKRLNRAIFDVVAHSLANPKLRKLAIASKDQILRSFKALCLDEEFRAAIESTTKSKQAVTNRFATWYKAINQATKEKVPVSLPK